MSSSLPHSTSRSSREKLNEQVERALKQAKLECDMDTALEELSRFSVYTDSLGWKIYEGLCAYVVDTIAKSMSMPIENDKELAWHNARHGQILGLKNAQAVKDKLLRMNILRKKAIEEEKQKGESK